MKFYATLALVFLYFSRIDGSGECGEVTVEEWGGLKSSKVQYLLRPVDLVIIQHTVTPECSTDQQCADRVKSIQSYHVEQLHYDNIGPNFLVGGNGKVYMGAGWALEGAHTRGYNNRSIGLTFIGDFRTKEPTADALQAAKDLIECGVNKNYLSGEYRLVAHRQVKATESPGARLYDLVKQWPHWTRDLSAPIFDIEPRCQC